VADTLACMSITTSRLSVRSYTHTGNTRAAIGVPPSRLGGGRAVLLELVC
jgi:hypothetical protein